MKPYYHDEKVGITIYHGDCRDVLPHLTRLGLLLTDIPYGEVNRQSNGLRSLYKGNADRTTVHLEDWLPQTISLVTDCAYIWCGTEQISGIRATLVRLGLSTRLCIWEKTNPSPMNGDYLWLSSIECCIYGRKPHAVHNASCRSPVWRGPSAVDNGHPTPKPEWLMRRLILASSRVGETVCDPFAGSGTTLRAAKDLQRHAIGIEISEEYCEIAARRLSQEVLPLEAV